MLLSKGTKQIVFNYKQRVYPDPTFDQTKYSFIYLLNLYTAAIFIPFKTTGIQKQKQALLVKNFYSIKHVKIIFKLLYIVFYSIRRKKRTRLKYRLKKRNAGGAYALALALHASRVQRFLFLQHKLEFFWLFFLRMLSFFRYNVFYALTPQDSLTRLNADFVLLKNFIIIIAIFLISILHKIVKLIIYLITFLYELCKVLNILPHRFKLFISKYTISSEYIDLFVLNLIAKLRSYLQDHPTDSQNDPLSTRDTKRDPKKVGLHIHNKLAKFINFILKKNKILPLGKYLGLKTRLRLSRLPSRVRHIYLNYVHCYRINFVTRCAVWFRKLKRSQLSRKPKFLKFKTSFYASNLRPIEHLSIKFLTFKKVFHIFISYLTYSLVFVYSFLKTTVLSLSIAALVTYLLTIYYTVDFVKQLAIWLICGFLFLWLVSGFNFFIKRYRFGKFTAAIQRFWKRANACFWLIEGFLFLLFYYYYLNSSSEPIYMHDYSCLNQEHLINLTNFYFNSLLLSLLILFLLVFTTQLNYLTFPQQLIFILAASIVVFFIFFLESYQFYYVLNCFDEWDWTFEEDEDFIDYWLLQGDTSQTVADDILMRTKHFYFFMCLIAKYWHFLFIFISWIFFIIKSFERRHVSYTLLAVNVQNFIILYFLNLLCCSSWLKWLYRRFFDAVYYWFFLNPDFFFIIQCFEEILTIILSIKPVSFLVDVLALDLLIIKSSYNYFLDPSIPLFKYFL